MSRPLFPVLLVATLFAIALVGLRMQTAPEGSVTANRQDDRRARYVAYVYPDASPQAAVYRQIIQQHAGLYRRYLPARAVPASVADTIRFAARIVVVGRLADLPWQKIPLADFPVRHQEGHLIVNGRRYSDSLTVLIMRLPGSERNRPTVQLITGNSDAAITQFLRQPDRLWRLPGHYVIYQNLSMITYGFLNPHTLQPERETFLLTNHRILFEDAFLVVESTGAAPDSLVLKAFVDRRRQDIQRICDLLQLSSHRKAELLPIRYRLYDSAESKTLATWNSQFASWTPGDSVIHCVFGDGIGGDDGKATASLLAYHWAGAVHNPALRQALGILLTPAWAGEGYGPWAGRLARAGLFMPISDLIVSTTSSTDVDLPALVQLATFLDFLLEEQGPQSLRQFVGQVPEQPTKADIEKLIPAEQETRWQAWCRQRFPFSPPVSLPRTLAFARGFCYAHEGYSVYNGYMGHTSRASLERLRELQVNAISITPFGYLRDPHKPAPLRRSSGPGSENDESLVVAARMAKDLGMWVMLKPHILLAGGGHWGWPGDIAMTTDRDWQSFFRHYRRWIAHYAMLAQIYGFDSLCIGVELSQTTLDHEAEWRELISAVRNLYGGPLVYAANWGTEFENLRFWDALDYIGVNCYYPLSADSQATDFDLQQGAREVVERIATVAQRHRKPVWITEIGFASRPACWVEPHRDGRRAPVDLEAQRRCYQAMFQALEGQQWLAGIFWWKWPTTLEDGGTGDSDFTPNGKPAEQVVARWYRSWTERSAFSN